ncbi:MAG: IPT/TIG domain-containing protein [Armatimonadetes bacterium]|jgi:hypothetical protein|nr:IPT/TIG domain-containing protein [Armatimonadota bacterium]GBC90827.1 hypothetical protein HRbin14_01582 [bacterium HR14]
MRSKQWSWKWSVIVAAVLAGVWNSGFGQVLSRLGQVYDDPPGVQSVFEGNWIYSLSSTQLLITLEANSALVKRGVLSRPGMRSGYTTAIAKGGNLVYIANDSVFPSASYLTIVNVSNPASPSIVVDFQMPSSVPSTLSIVKNGNYLYMFPESGDMQVVDISNPASPAIVRSVSMTGSGGVVVGNRLYTAERSNGVGVWDVSQPDNPNRIGRANLTGNIQEVLVSGSRLYALSGFSPTALHILDLSNPDSPTLLATFNTTYIADMASYGNYLYLSSGLGKTQIVDVSNPSAPAEVAVLDLGRVQAIEPASARLLTAGSSWLRVYSLSNPTNPTRTAEYTVPAPDAAVKSGDRVYTAEELGVGVYNLATPSSPTFEQVVPVSLNCREIAQISADTFAVAHEGNLSFVRFTGGSGNVVWTHTATPPSQSMWYDRLRVSGNVLAFACSPTFNSVRLIDISNPESPQVGADIRFIVNFDVGGGYLYSAFSTSPSNFRIYSIADINSPTQVASLDIPFSASDIAVGGSYALVTGSSGELALVDVSNPAAPQLIAQRTMAGASMPKVRYDNGYFFVYDGSNRKLEVYRVADFPNFNPYRTQTLDTYGIRHLYFDQNIVIGSASTEGLIVYQNLLGTSGMTITLVTPNRAGNAGALTIMIEGSGFPQNATVRLERGSVVIEPTSVVVRSANRIDATFDFTGQPVNTQWDVVVRSPDNAEARLPSALTIVEPVPTISSISPNRTLPSRSVTLTISGELFTPNARVEIRPSESDTFTPISARSVQFVSQRQLSATFDLSPLHVLNLSYDRTVSVVVTNTNNRSASGTLIVRGPNLDLQVAETVFALRENQDLAVEVVVSGAVEGEPIEFEMYGWVGSDSRTIRPARTEALGSGRWRLTFNRAEALPNGFLQSWTPGVRQLGARDTSDTISVHQYRGVRMETGIPQFSNLIRPLTISVLAFDADENTTFVLRKGDVVREPTQITRNTQTYAGGTVFEGTFPIQLTDLGQWSIEVRYGDETKTIANALEIIKGTPYISRADWRLSPWQRDSQIVLRGSGFHEGMRGVLVIENPNAVIDASEITATAVTVNSDGTEATLVFENLFDAIRAPSQFRLELRSPYANSVSWYNWQSFAPPSVRMPARWGPSFFRAGRWETFTVAVSTGGQIDAPILSFVVPFTESDLNSGAYDFEYRIVDTYTGRVLQSGRRRATPENVLLVAQLPPMPADTTRYINIEIRAFSSGRAAAPHPQLTRGRVVVVAYVAVSGLFIAGSMVLKASCEVFQRYGLQTAIATALAEQDFYDLTGSQRSALLDWLLEERNMRALLNTFSYTNKSVFDYFGSEITSEIVGRGADAIKQAISTKVNYYLLGKFSRLDSDKRREYAELLTNAYFDLWQAQNALRSGDATDIVKSKSEQILGEIWKLATSEASETPLEPPAGLDLSQIPAEALGALLNATANTFLSVATGCIERSRKLEQLFTQVQNVQPLPVRTSWDPNEKRGTQGVAGYIAPDQSIVYEILFENLPTATAGAEEVLVEDTLPEALDPSTLEFFEVQVGDKRVSLPEGTNTLNTQIDLRPNRPVVVRVVSDYDPSTRKLSVRFSGIDPNTNDYYQEGFLPPNTNPPQGEGAVRFRIRPREDVASGTRIDNHAVITFDPHLQANPPIVTNTHSLTLDKQPPAITVESPDSTTLPTTKATLRWSATDDASGVAEVEIWAQEGDGARRLGYTSATGERNESGTVLVRARRFGDETRIITRGRDRVGNLVPFGDTPQLTLRFGQPPQFSAGLHLVGIPVQLDNPDVQAAFGFQNDQWATYNPATGQYVQHPDSGASPQIGRGYWVVLPNPVQPNIVGNLPDPEQSYTIALQQGWNLIANPWTEPLVWNRAAIGVRVNGVSYTLDQAVAQQFVEPYLWGWEPNPSNSQQGRYRLIYDAQLLNGIDHQLQPWRGYWIYAHQPCELVLPTPEVAASTPSRSRNPATQGGWSLRIGAHWGDQYDEVMVGVSGTEQGLQVAMPPAPPGRAAATGVQLRLVREGRAMEADILPRSRSQQRWTLELSVPPSDAPRTLLLTTPDIAYLPRGVNPMLRDLETGAQRLLRSSAGWQIPVPPEGLSKRFELSLVSTSRLLRITNLQVQGGRSAGGAYTVRFTLSDSAKVTVAIQAGGRTVRTLEQGRSRSLGSHQLVWEGRDQQGRALPPGSYTLVIRAETDDGQVARATLPLVLTR